MKKYIEFAGIVAVIVLFLVFIDKFESCSKKKTEKIVEMANTSILRANLIDSLNTVHLKQKDSILQAKTIELNTKYKQLANENKKLSKKYDELLSEYNLTPEIQTEICDTIIESANNIIENQSEIIQNKDSLIEIKDSLLFNCKKNVTFKQEMIDRCNSENLALELELKKKNNWWNRNSNWIIFTGGLITGALILK